MSERTPVGAVISARVILHLPDKPLHLVLRTGCKGKLGFPGGKVMHRECLLQRVRDEVEEETTLSVVGNLSAVTTFYMPTRTKFYEADEWEELGFDPSRKCLAGLVRAWNPIAVFFSAAAEGALPTEPVEGRRVSILELSREILKLIKPPHRVIASHWLRHIEHGEAIPPLVIYRG